MSRKSFLSFSAKTVWCAALVLGLVAAAQAQGFWSCTHGHAGNIEYIDRVDTLDRVHIGWGLDFDQSPGLINWIHFAVPSVHGTTSRYIALQFYTGSPDAIVKKVHVYNLATKVKTFEGTAGGLNVSNGWYLKVLDMGSDISFSAIGISVEVAAGVEMMSHRFLFTGACALIDEP